MTDVTPTGLVIGAEGLIGSTVAARLSRRMHVIAVNRESGGGDASTPTGHVDGLGRETIHADVSTMQGRRGLLDRVSPTHVVICDPPTAARPLAETTEQDWLAVDQAGPRSTFFLLRDLCPRLSSSGAVVVVTSVAGKSARNPEIVPYSAGQAAILSLVRSFANAYAPTGPRVNAVCTGIIDGPHNEEYLRSVAQSRAITMGELARTRFAMVPMGRAGQAEDCAATVEFLLSSGARFITGQSVNVTGGFHQQ